MHFIFPFKLTINFPDNEMNRHLRLEIVLDKVSNPEELDLIDQKLLSSAQEATETAYAPYSGFRVGAAVLLEGDTIVSGSNQENASYPQGLCAERVAIFSAASQHAGKRILSVAIAAWDSKTNSFCAVTPCGGCRQVMLEFEQKQKSSIKVLFPGPDTEILIAPSTEALLPFGFKRSNPA